VPELTAADVVQYTGGRLSLGAETTRLLDAALKAVRRYCGWHVTPVQTDTGMVLDGPGGRVLSLPTLRLVTLTALSENGTALDVDDDVYVSSAGLVRKVSGAWWTSRYGGITVTMSHGFADATDWQSAVLELVDRMSMMPGTAVGGSGPMMRKRVDDVEYAWQTTIGDPGNQNLFDLINHRLVDPYRIEPLR
jgi:hypothetical protein